MTIRLNDVHAIKLIAQQAHVRYVPGQSHCISQYDSRDVLMAGVLFTDWNQGSIQQHTAVWGGTGGLRPLLWLVFQYPFIQLGVKKIFGLVPEFNIQARNLNLHLGYKIEYLADDVFGYGDGTPNGMYLMSMRKEECRWLTMKCPPIEYAPLMFTNIVHPLRDMPTLGSMQ